MRQQLIFRVNAHHIRAQAHVSTTSVQDTLRQSLATPTLADRQSLHVLLQIQVEVLHDEVELVAVGMNNVEEAHDVRIFHFLEQRDFADGGGRDTLVLSLKTDLLEGDNALVGRAEIAGLVDDTVRTCKEG